MTPVTIREARHDDLQSLLALYQHLNPNDLPLPAPAELEKLWGEILQKEIPVIFLAETDGVLVGSCALAVIPGLTRGARPFGVIENVVTHAAHRRQGIGTTLLQHAVSCAWERRCYKVMLLTGSKRPEMLRFYDSAGFQAGVKTGFVMWHPNVQIPLRSPTR